MGDHSLGDETKRRRAEADWGPIDADWRERSACKGLDIEMFFPETHDARASRAARAVCRDCPVRLGCLYDGLAELHGIWGGFSYRELRAVRVDIAKGRRFIRNCVDCNTPFTADTPDAVHCVIQEEEVA